MESKEYYKKLFPLLSNYELVPNSESYLYNCISHTININSIPSWPTDPDYYWPVKREVTKEAFDLFYEYHGFQKLNLIDFSYDVRYIIKHDLFEIENKTYGQVTQIYKMNRNLNEILFFNEFILLD